MPLPAESTAKPDRRSACATASASSGSSSMTSTRIVVAPTGRRDPSLRRAPSPAAPSAVQDLDGLELLRAAGNVVLGEDADATGVELRRHNGLLQPAPLIGAHHVVVGARGNRRDGVALHDPRLVLGMVASVLLPVCV